MECGADQQGRPGRIGDVPLRDPVLAVARHIRLHRESVMQVAVIGGRPQVSLIARFDQLASDANARAIASNASLQHAVDAQLRGNLSYGFRRGLVLNRRSSSNHAQALGIKPAELRNRLFRQSLGKVFLLVITA